MQSEANNLATITLQITLKLRHTYYAEDLRKASLVENSVSETPDQSGNRKALLDTFTHCSEPITDCVRWSIQSRCGLGRDDIYGALCIYMERLDDQVLRRRILPLDVVIAQGSLSMLLVGLLLVGQFDSLTIVLIKIQVQIYYKTCIFW